MTTNKPTPRAKNVKITRQIERLHRLFFPAETFRANPRTTGQKAKILYRKKWANFSQNGLHLTTKAHVDYWFKNGLKKSWNNLTVAQRERIIEKFIRQLNPKGIESVDLLATRFALLSAFMELKTAKMDSRQVNVQLGSTQYTEAPAKAIQYTNLIDFYRKTAAGLRARKIDPITGKFVDS